MSSLILGFSTSHGTAEVCAANAQGHLVFSYHIEDYRQQSAELLPRLVAALAAHGLQSSAFAALAVNIGPGGFTSLRTACGIAQGLGTAWHLPVLV
ncbi:MAG: tRNA (adenosine(37)-N6)-threonylcarbamoyltransferase complex dimerization subunit type 1 TsaB [Limnobacter sp.]|nr:tRNA (adenosine(37)-N6)-threonylcarbamoyltransferase complex dimerization subunit type 1 TsaB [Limnobacter sp.]